MIGRLRTKLTCWFIFLFIVTYTIDAFMAFWNFDYQLSETLQRDLKLLCQEIAVSIDYRDGKPQMQDWLIMSAKRHVPQPATVQIFDPAKKLVQNSGLPGLEELHIGRFNMHLNRERISGYSCYSALPAGYFLQVQIPAYQHDTALKGFIIFKLWRSAIMILTIGIFGWIFSGKAIEPVTRTFESMRKFIDDASHELNTPIALIQNSTELLEAKLKDNAATADVVQIINRSVNRLKELSHSLLTLSKAEQLAEDTPLEPQDISVLLTELLHDFAKQAVLKNIDLRINELPQTKVLADREALTRVFSNLIENALRYTPSGGSITISGIKKDGTITISVQDTGIGIPEASQPYIFDRFYRVDSSRSRENGGYGLGLAIVKAIIEKHQGTIAVASNEGRGSNFLVILPLL